MDFTIAQEPSGFYNTENKRDSLSESLLFSGGEGSRTPVQNHVHVRSYKCSLRI